MTYEQFCDQISDALVLKFPKPLQKATDNAKKKNWRYRDVKFPTYPNEIDLYENQPCFMEVWRSGGMSGGNCWGGKAKESRSRDTEPDMVSLDKFLAECYPDISFLRYKMIMGLLKRCSQTEYEYYGNSTDWSCKYILIEDLYKAFLEMRMIQRGEE